MKVSKDRINAAIAGTLNSLFSMQDLAKMVVKRCNGDFPEGKFELQSSKIDSFSIRQAKGLVVGKPFLHNAVCKAIGSLYLKSQEEFDDHMADEYDIDFDVSMIDDAFVDAVFTLSSNGRILYVEVDS